MGRRGSRSWLQVGSKLARLSLWLVLLRMWREDVRAPARDSTRRSPGSIGQQAERTIVRWFDWWLASGSLRLNFTLGLLLSEESCVEVVALLLPKMCSNPYEQKPVHVNLTLKHCNVSCINIALSFSFFFFIAPILLQNSL